MIYIYIHISIYIYIYMHIYIYIIHILKSLPGVAPPRQLLVFLRAVVRVAPPALVSMDLVCMLLCGVLGVGCRLQGVAGEQND